MAEETFVLQKQGHNFEVVFMSLDHTEMHYNASLQSMPWPALPFQDPKIRALTRRCSIDELPTLVVFDTTGDLITPDGVSVVSERGAAGFPWQPQKGAVKELSVASDEWEATLSVVILMETASTQEQQRLKDAVNVGFVRSAVTCSARWVT